jgi:SAM-dependent methyltransferase
MDDRVVLRRIYRAAGGDASRLPWHRDQPPALLPDALRAHRAGRRRALDLGCGSGDHAVFMARHGYRVTAVDYLPEALEMAAATVAHAERDGIIPPGSVELVDSDVLAWDADEPYDVVLDSGCLHGMRGRQRDRYRRSLDTWMAPDASLVLVHALQRGFPNRRPFAPHPCPRETVLDLIGPRFTLCAEHRDMLRGRGLADWPWYRLGTFWLRRV